MKEHVNPDGTKVMVPDSASIGEWSVILPNIKIPDGLNGMSFSGLQYTATVNGDKIVIGCHVKTVDEWLEVKEAEAVEMGLRRELYPQYRAFGEMVKAYLEKYPEKEGSRE